MNLFDINIRTIIIRFYLMMAVVILGVFTGMYWLTILALPIFLSAMLGIGFAKSSKKETRAVAKKEPQRMQQAA